MTRLDLWCPQPVSGLRLFELEDGAILQDPARRKIHSLNPWATVVWLLCNGHRSAQEIVALVAPGDEPFRRAIIALLASLQREGLVQ